jgi:hypothetical protein
MIEVPVQREMVALTLLKLTLPGMAPKEVPVIVTRIPEHPVVGEALLMLQLGGTTFAVTESLAGFPQLSVPRAVMNMEGAETPDRTTDQLPPPSTPDDSLCPWSEVTVTVVISVAANPLTNESPGGMLCPFIG